MTTNPQALIRQLLPTSYGLLLKRHLYAEIPKVTGSVLIIGAGHDPHRRLLKAASTVVSTDICDPSGILDLIADAHDLPLPDNSFDGVLAMEVFEHLHTPERAAAEILRVLKPGGIALVSVPFMFHIHGDPMDFTRFTDHGLRRLFQDFAEVTVIPYGGRVHVVSDLITTASKWLFPLRVFNWLWAMVPTPGSRDSASGYWIRLTA